MGSVTEIKAAIFDIMRKQQLHQLHVQQLEQTKNAKLKELDAAEAEAAEAAKEGSSQGFKPKPKPQLKMADE